MPEIVYTYWLDSTILVNGVLTPSVHSSLYELILELPSSLPKSMPQVRVMVLELLEINLGFVILAGKIDAVICILAIGEGSVHPLVVWAKTRTSITSLGCMLKGSFIRAVEEIEQWVMMPRLPQPSRTWKPRSVLISTLYSWTSPRLKSLGSVQAIFTPQADKSSLRTALAITLSVSSS
jgi:hypothetical protein